MSDWLEGYLEAVEKFLMENGEFVGLRNYEHDRWTDLGPDEYSSWNATYGWHEAGHYIVTKTRKNEERRLCRPTMVDMSTLRERTLSQFQDTFTTNANEVGLEVRAYCECGKFENKWLRWTGSITDILPKLLGIEVTTYYG